MNIPGHYRNSIIAGLDKTDLESVRATRGNLQELKTYIMANSPSSEEYLLDFVDDLLLVNKEIHDFLVETKRTMTSAEFTKLARLFNAGGDISLAFEEIVTKEDLVPAEAMVNVLSVILNYMGNSQYIKSENEDTEAVIQMTTLHLYDAMWGLVREYRKNAKPEDIKKLREDLNGFFSHLSNRSVSAQERIVVITRLYQSLYVLYLNSLRLKVTWSG